MKKKILLRIFNYIKPYLHFLIAGIIFALLTVAAQLYIPILTGDAIDFMLYGKTELAAVMKYLISIGVSAAVFALSQWLLGICNNHLAFCVSRDMRTDAIRKIQSLPLSYLDTHSSGDIVSRIIADVDTFSDGLLMGFSQLFTGLMTILGTLILMLTVNPAVTAVVVCVTPLSLIVAAFIARKTHKYFQTQTSVRGEETAFINETVGGIRVVASFCHEDENIEVFDEINERYKKASLKAVFFSSTTNPATRFVNNIVYAGVGLSGALFAVAGKITVGQLSMFLSYANQYTKPFNEISGVITEFQNALACAERLFELFDEPSEIPDASDAVNITADGRVELQNVSFCYNPQNPLIENFNLEIKNGQHIAIVGPTGCGKTTLINLLMRFYDVNEGKIIFSGEDVRNITRFSLRRGYGMVLQETWLKRATVKDNIAFGFPEATEEQIIAAAKAAHADSFIRRLPQGYDTLLSEDGGNLSQGQKQLLCIARVMLRLPPVLILDEATSSIDTRTELRIQSAFSRMMQGRTSFVVAHRLSTIRDADVILVMNEGHIVEQGSHEELLKKNGFYAKLYSQS